MNNQEQLKDLPDNELAREEHLATQGRGEFGIVLIREEWERRRMGKQHELNLKLVAEQNKAIRSAATITGRYTIIATLLGALTGFILGNISPNLSHLQSYSPQKPKIKITTNSVSSYNPLK